MKALLLTLAIILLSLSNSYAQESDQLLLAKQLAQVLGFENMMSGLKQQTQLSTDMQITQMMDQFKKSFPDIPPQYMKELSEACSEFSKKVSSAWDPAEASRIYSVALAKVLSKKDLHESIEHYRTPEGQLQLKAISEAATELNTYVLSSIQKATQASTQELISKLKIITEKARRDRVTTKDTSGKTQPSATPVQGTTPIR